MVRAEVVEWMQNGGITPELYPESWVIVESDQIANHDAEAQMVDTVNGKKLLVKEEIAQAASVDYVQTLKRIGVTFKPITIDGTVHQYSEVLRLTGWATELARIGIAPLVVSINGRAGLFVPSEKAEAAWNWVLRDTDPNTGLGLP